MRVWLVETTARADCSMVATLRAAGGLHTEEDFALGADVAEFVEHTCVTGIAGVGGMGSKEANRAVTPVVALAGAGILRIKLEDRQEFDCRYSQLFKIGDLVDDSGVGAAAGAGQTRAGILGEAGNMHLVDDGGGKRMTRHAVIFPVVA